jgi:parallel beta-helix repeat protein
MAGFLAQGRRCRPAPARAYEACLLAVLLSAVVGLGAFTALPAAAATPGFFVDRTVAGCSDTGPGDEVTPFCGLATGVAHLGAGDTLYVGDGTYAETIQPPVSGTAGNPVTITRWPGRSPTIAGSGTYGASIVSRAFITITGLVFDGTVKDGIRASSSNNLTISGNIVRGAGKPQSGATANGITLTSTSSSLVSGNTTEHNNGHGILVSSSSTGNTVADNSASFNAEGWRRNANGIDVTAPGNSVLRNVTHDNEDSGIQFYTGGNNNLAALNVTYNNGDHGIDNLNVTGGRLINNTVFRNCTSGINVEGTSGSYTVMNNVAVDNAVYPAYAGIACSRRAGNIGIWDSAPPTTTVDHNLVWLSTSGKQYVFKSAYTSLAAMQAATGQEQHGVQGDPRFAGPAGWDLRITAGSPAIDRADSGVSGAQGSDVLGNPRTDDPGTANTFASGPRPYDDLGAYELQSGSTPQPSPPTAALSVTPASGTAPLQVTADASASSDPQSQALTYSFDFGDGTQTAPQSTPTTTHTYSTAGSYTLTVTVTDTSGLSDVASRTVTATQQASTPPAFVSPIANNYSTSTKTSGYITVWRSAGVRAGDLVVLTLQLTGASPTGTVSAIDAAGNTYTQAATVSDATGNRLVLLTGVLSRALGVNDRITATFPTATSYRLGGEEFAGVTQVDGTAGATGSGSAFASGTAPAAVGNEIAFGAVSIPAGTTNPGWASGWKDLGSSSTGSRYLGRAYRLLASGGQQASGTESGAWLCLAVTLRP